MIGLRPSRPAKVLPCHPRTRRAVVKYRRRSSLQCIDVRLLAISGHSAPHLARSAYSQKRTLALPDEVEHWSLTTLREKLIKIGAKVVRHGRYVTFQLGDRRSADHCHAVIARIPGS